MRTDRACGSARSDYGHADTSTELEALRNLPKTSPLEPRVIKKILEDNPKALYGL